VRRDGGGGAGGGRKEEGGREERAKSNITNNKSHTPPANPTRSFARALKESRPKINYVSFRLLNALKAGDSVKKLISILPTEAGWCDTRLGPLVDDATPLIMCIRFGRRRCVLHLIQNMNASLSIPDGNGMSPLGSAAWAGHENVVKDLLGSGQDLRLDLERKGVPFQTSSCGGKGPHTPEEWARRKGFAKIVRLLEKYRKFIDEADKGR